MAAIIAIMATISSSLLLVFPPVGTVIGVSVILLAVIGNLHLAFLKLIVTEDEIIRQSMFGNRSVRIDTIQELHSMRVVGTVANSPLAVRKVVLDTTDDLVEVGVLLFKWQQVLDVLEAIDLRIQS